MLTNDLALLHTRWVNRHFKSLRHCRGMLWYDLYMSASSLAFTLTNPAHSSLIDSFDPETAGWSVTLSPCKWGSLGPGGCPCGPAPCLVVLSADWLTGVRLFFTRCGPAAGTKTRRTDDDAYDAASSRINRRGVNTDSILPLAPFGWTLDKFKANISICVNQEWRYGVEEVAIRTPGFDGVRSNRAAQESRRVGLNENTTRLVVCIPVLVSPSCCNPIFTYPRIYFPFGGSQNRHYAFRRNQRDELARACWWKPCILRFLTGHYLPPRAFSSFRPGPPGPLSCGFTRNEHRYTFGGGQISGMASPTATDHTW